MTFYSVYECQYNYAQVHVVIDLFSLCQWSYYLAYWSFLDLPFPFPFPAMLLMFYVNMSLVTWFVQCALYVIRVGFSALEGYFICPEDPGLQFFQSPSAVKVQDAQVGLHSRQGQ